MNSASRRLLALALVTGLAAAPSAAFATNGYFLIGFGAISRGMGGVGVADGQDGLAAASNPAAMADVPASVMRMDVGADLFIPRRGVVIGAGDSALNTTGSNIDLVSQSNLFLIPNMGGIYRFTPRITVGMAVVGAGMGTRYDQSVPGAPTCFNDGNPTGSAAGGSYFFNSQCAGSKYAGVSLMQMQMLPSIAYRIDKVNTVGASLALAVQQFRAYGLQAFQTPFAYTSGNNGHLTNEGNDWSYGAGIRLGWIGHFLHDRVRVGANWSSRVYMTRFRKYTNLFAQHGTFDIPENWTLGVLVRPTHNIDVEFDWQRILWDSVNSVGNIGPTASNPSVWWPTPSDPNYLGNSNGLGFGWKNRNVYKLGVAYKPTDRLTLRAGFNYSKSPIPRDQVLFNALAPATVQRHLTFGLSYQQTPAIEWSFSYVHAFKHTIKGPSVFGPVSIALVENAFGVSFGYSM